MMQLTTTVNNLLDTIRQSYAPGDKLPNEQTLASELGVSRATIREAVAKLVSNGVLQKRWGVGTFVVRTEPSDGFGLLSFRPGIVKSLEVTGGTCTLTHVELIMGDPDPENFPDFPQSPIAHLQRAYALDGAGIMVVNDRLVASNKGAHLALADADWIADTIPEMYDEIGLTFDAMTCQLAAGPLTDEQQRLLGADHPEPAIHVDGVAVDDHMRIIVRLNSVIRTSVSPTIVSTGPYFGIDPVS